MPMHLESNVELVRGALALCFLSSKATFSATRAPKEGQIVFVQPTCDPSTAVGAENLVYTVSSIPSILLISLVAGSLSLRHSNGLEDAICIRCQELFERFVNTNMLSYPFQGQGRASMPRK